MDDRPIIIIKKKVNHEGHHGGAWKVAYADFVTAMMAFFLVMWIIGLSQPARQAIAAYFNDPVGFLKSQSGGKKVFSPSAQPLQGKPAITQSLKSLMQPPAGGAESNRFKIAKQALEKMISELPELKEFKRYIEIELTKDGLRIELLEGAQSLFYETGSAKIKPETIHILQLIGKELAKLPNRIMIEGHTDGHSYSGGLTGYSNWELSTDRANGARRAMATTLRPNQVSEVRGYADQRLRNAADPYHFSNRRISIMVEYSQNKDASMTKEVGPKDFGESAMPQTPAIKPE